MQLDFDTPNEAAAVPTIERRKPPRPPKEARPVCPFCFEQGIHQSAAQCLYALENAVSPSRPPSARKLALEA
jgi:hypothetical protein